MLAEMRQLTRGWLARGLLILISLALAVTLFQMDFVAGLQGLVNPNSVAVVGGRSITPQELDRDFSNFLKQSEARGRPASRADAIEQNVPAQVLNMMIGQKALYALAEKLGVETSDQVVGEAIRSLPPAQNPMSGSFDDAIYQNFLREVGYTHAGLVETMRSDLSAEQLLQALTDGVRAPRSFGAMLLAFQSETRVVSVAQIPGDRVGEIPQPTDAQVQTLYRELAPRLRVPEYRAVTLVTARLADFAARVNVPEARIREEFDRRRPQLSQPEKRSFVQIAAQTEAQARNAAQRLARGEDAAAVAQALNLQTIAHDQKAQPEIPDPAIARAAFAMPAGAPPQAVRGSLSPWAAVRGGEVTPAVEANFEEHREDIRNALAQDEARGLLDEAITAFNDAQGEGTPVAQAARASGFTVTAIPAVDAQGRAPDGSPVEAFVDQPDLVSAAAETQQGEATDFMPLEGDVEALVQVDTVTPETTRPLAEVRPQLTQMWIARERARRLNEIGARMVEAINSGRSFADAAAAERATILTRSDAIDRASAQGFLPQIFSAREGEAVSGVNPAGSVLVVAQVEEIRRADPAQQTAVVDEARTRIERGEGGLLFSMREAIEAAAIAAAKVRRNPALLERTYKGQDADAAK